MTDEQKLTRGEVVQCGECGVELQRQEDIVVSQGKEVVPHVVNGTVYCGLEHGMKHLPKIMA